MASKRHAAARAGSGTATGGALGPESSPGGAYGPD